MSELDKAEHETIARLVADIERKQADPRVATDTQNMLGEIAEHMKKRMEVLEQNGAVLDSRDRKENTSKMEAAIAAMVDRETRLNTSEKMAYASLLEKEYFTRNDFGELERFYADGGGWDKLSDKGKAEMSKRINEGIRRGHFEFSDLPEKVREKESRSRERNTEIGEPQKVFDYQLVDNQAATKRSKVAASPDGETDKVAPKKSYDLDGIDAGMLAGLSDATEAVKPDLPKTNGGDSPSLPS